MLLSLILTNLRQTSKKKKEKIGIITMYVNFSLYNLLNTGLYSHKTEVPQGSGASRLCFDEKFLLLKRYLDEKGMVPDNMHHLRKFFIL